MKLPEPKKRKGGTWYIQLRLNGVSRYVNGSTAKECRDKARLLKSEYSAGVREIKKGVPTLTEAIDKYIDKRRNTLSPSTIEGYRHIQRGRFVDVMQEPIDAKTDWQAVCNAEALLCAPKTLRNAYRFIVSVLSDNGIAAQKVTLPPVVSKPRAWLEPEQIPPLVAAAVGTPSAFPVLLALHSLRRSELLAVTWDDIDLQRGMIHVSGAIVMDENRNYIEKPTNKTKSSNRVLPIMIPELRAALEDVPPDKRAGHLVTCSPNTVPVLINRACRSAGVPEVGTQGLRHSFASLAYHLRLSELETMKLGGWSDAETMRKIYTHLSERDKAKAQNKMAEFYKNACSRACD